MKKNLFFALFGATVLLSMNACKSELDLDKELKFSDQPVEAQKASIEQNGMDFTTAVEGMQDTKAITAASNLAEMNGVNATTAPMQRLVSDIKNGRKEAMSNFDKQMRVSYVKENSIWGEYTYNFKTKEIEKKQTLTNKLIVNFPATKTSNTNNANITVIYEESTVAIPEIDDNDLGGEKYPSKITFSMTVDGSEVMSAYFSGKYYDDGSPKDVTQSLKIDTYTWEAKIKNDKKTASESYQFKNGRTTLIKSLAEVKGTLTEAELENAMKDEKPENAISKFAIYFQVMNIAVKGGTTDFKGFATETKAIDYKTLSEKQATEKEAEILNKYMVCTGYFVKENRKFAEVEFYAAERIGYYEIAPRFILSDGSKVTVEEYVASGFDDLFVKIGDMVGNK